MKAWETLRKTTDPIYGGTDASPQALAVFHQAMGAYIAGDAHGFWLEPESGDGHCDPDRLVVTIGQRISAFYQLMSDGVQSPIEAMLAGALVWLEMDWAGMPSADFLNGPKDHIEQFGEPDGVVYYITPQAHIGKYRADFLVWFAMGKHYAGLIVECDGHDFHDKTKEQAARDKRRDRELLTAGYPVMRFTGSEIYKDAIGCAEQLRGTLQDLRDRVSRDGGLFGA